MVNQRISLISKLVLSIGLFYGASGAIAAPGEDSIARGKQVYNQQCAACHQAGGQGIPGSFPPQKGHTANVFNASGGMGGRDYLAHVLQYGLTGSIDVEGTSYNGNMPAWGGSLSDQQIADVLNYVLTAFGNRERLSRSFQPYTADEVNAVSGKDLSGKQVYQLRQAVVGSRGQSSGSVTSQDASVASMAAKVSLEQAIPKPIYAAVQDSGVVERLPSKSTWPGVKGAHYDALSPDGKQLMVSGFKTGNVYVMDTDNGEIQASIAIGEVVQGVKVSPDGRYGLAVAPTQGVVAIIDMETLSLVKKVSVGDTPHNIIFNKDSSLAYVTLQGEGALAVVDMTTLNKQRAIPTPGLDSPHNIDISGDGRRLWIRDFIGHVGVLDLDSERVLKVFKVGAGHGGIDVIPNSRYVATGAISASQVTVIDADSLAIVANLEVGTGPHGVRASADGRYLYTSVTADNMITIIDMGSLEVIRQEPVDGKFPFWLAVPGNP
mgnify:FL=1